MIERTIRCEITATGHGAPRRKASSSTPMFSSSIARFSSILTVCLFEQSAALLFRAAKELLELLHGSLPGLPGLTFRERHESTVELTVLDDVVFVYLDRDSFVAICCRPCDRNSKHLDKIICLFREEERRAGE